MLSGEIGWTTLQRNWESCAGCVQKKIGSWNSVAAAFTSKWVPQTEGRFICWICSFIVDLLTLGIKYWENTVELRLTILTMWLLIWKWWSSVFSKANDRARNKQFSPKIEWTFQPQPWRNALILLDAGCPVGNVALGISAALLALLEIDLHFLSSQHCFRLPGPPNLHAENANTTIPSGTSLTRATSFSFS